MEEMMYESPITVLRTQMETHIEDEILTAVHKVGVYVDKEELVKALAYDRDQYHKGYRDATPQWISVEDRLPEARDEGTVGAVLVTDGFLIHMGYFVDGMWYYCESGEMKEEMFYKVTHWMPLPEPPRE